MGSPASLMVLRRVLDEGVMRSEEVLDRALAAARDPAGEGGRTFLRIYENTARAQAHAADADPSTGATRGALAGIPVSIKDNFDVEGGVTRAGSASLEHAPPARCDSEVVARLKAAGAVIVGRTNMTEFAYSGIGINPHFGTPLNPFDRATGRIPGGSSSGAAVSVADGMAMAAVGTDTGGSVRIPAALCGLVGFKPTQRRVSLNGVLPLSPSLDSVGAIGHTVECCALLDSVLAGEVFAGIPELTLANLRLGVLQNEVLEDLETPVAGAFSSALTAVSAAGLRLSDFRCSAISEIRYYNQNGGFAAIESYAWHRGRLAQHGEEYDPRVLSRIMRGCDLGSRVLEDLIGARKRITAIAAACFSRFDAILIPTVKRIAPLVRHLENDDSEYFDANAAMLSNPSIVNFLDGCALSIPCHKPGEAPVGLTVAALAGEDQNVLRIGRAIEDVLCHSVSGIARNLQIY